MADDSKINKVLIGNPKVFTTRSNCDQFFDSVTKMACADSYESYHVWNELKNFINTVGDSSTLVRIGSLETDWRVNNNKYHYFKVTKFYYIPDSPVKVLSLTCLENEVQNHYGNLDEEDRYITKVK